MGGRHGGDGRRGWPIFMGSVAKAEGDGGNAAGGISVDGVAERACSVGEQFLTRVGFEREKARGKFQLAQELVVRSIVYSSKARCRLSDLEPR